MKDYYEILGIAPDAGQTDLKRAFRKKAKQYHPDRGEGSCSEQFREIREAYEVLSDPKRRSTYDRQRAAAKERSGGRISVRPSERGGVRYRDAMTEFFETFDGLFFGGSRRDIFEELDSFADHDIEVVLAPGESRFGVLLPLRLDFTESCPDCRGSGPGLASACSHCHGRGRVRRRRTVHINIPPGLIRPTLLEYSFESGRGAPLKVRVLVRVLPEEIII